MTPDTFHLLDQWETLKAWAVERAPALAERLAQVRDADWRAVPVAEAQVLAIVAALDLDDAQPAARRRARKLLRQLEPALDGAVAEEPPDLADTLDDRQREKLRRTLLWIRDEPPATWLASASGPRAAITRARRKAPALAGRRAARWLGLLGYPAAVDDASRERPLQRLGWMPEGADVLGACEAIALAAGAPLLEVDAVLAALGGGGGAGCVAVALCSARDPRCGDCPLSGPCPHARVAGASPAAASRGLIATTRPEDRPRERLLAEGPGRLAEADLLAILLRTGRREENAIQLAQRLLKRAGTLRQLSAMAPGELAAIDGVGPAKAATVLAALELARRMGAEPSPAGEGMTQARHVFERLRPRFLNVDQEHVVVLLLNNRLKVIRESTVTVGILNRALVHAREAFREAVREGAHAVIFAHNHPSGDPAPSRDDDSITQQLVKAGDTIGIRVLDHVIIGRDAFYSYADEGRL